MAWYPAGHRRSHEEEMIGVLLAAARPGQRRPRLTEAANLIWGALLIRLRPTPADARLATWGDALATFSVALPLFMLAKTVSTWFVFILAKRVSTWLAVSLFYQPAAGFFVAFGKALLLPGQLVLVVLVLLRLRRTAALAALAMAIFSAGLIIHTGSWSSAAPFGLLVALLEAAALAASPGPRRGLQILAGWRALLPALAGTAAGVLPLSTWRLFPHPVVIQATAFVVAAVLVAALAVTSPLSRYVLLLFLIPVFPLAVGVATDLAPTFWVPARIYGSGFTGYLLALYYGVPMLVASLVAVFVLRARRRTVPGGAPPA